MRFRSLLLWEKNNLKQALFNLKTRTQFNRFACTRFRHQIQLSEVPIALKLTPCFYARLSYTSLCFTPSDCESSVIIRFLSTQRVKIKNVATSGKAKVTLPICQLGCEGEIGKGKCFCFIPACLNSVSCICTFLNQNNPKANFSTVCFLLYS